ncbi:cytokinin dehydrogenase 4-like, partial [Carica papaya]|uniref:cytokinin dehydrogenase 4-like n=1 Tax=Carica papaya TaxID=3649 RepID=UPI000B8CBE5A
MLQSDPKSIQAASHDFGNITELVPAGVLCPSSVSDITSFINSVFLHQAPPPVAARGAAHSVRGQAMALKGVVVNMTCLNSGVLVSGNHNSGFYADVGGEQLWIDVMKETLKAGLTPVSWTDYLYLTVGGTLSNAGIGGQTFRHGPQIANVHELDVVT